MSETIMGAAKGVLTWIEKELGMSDVTTGAEQASIETPPAPPVAAVEPGIAASALRDAIAELTAAHQASSSAIGAAMDKVKSAITVAEASGLKVEHNITDMACQFVTSVEQFGVSVWQKI